MIYLEDAVSQDIVDELIEHYESGGDYDTISMKKSSALSTMKILENIDAIDTDRIQIAHFYKHKAPYYPHSDFHFIEKENIVLPLQVTDGLNPYLVIFDQYYNDDACTWTGTSKVKFKINTGLEGRPYDSNITNKTNAPIPNYLYNKYLNWQPKDFWFGLSGQPFEFKPGNMIQFDSTRIHATSTMHCQEKLGLTIRYKL